jgi:hypothetical protein
MCDWGTCKCRGWKQNEKGKQHLRIPSTHQTPFPLLSREILVPLLKCHSTETPLLIMNDMNDGGLASNNIESTIENETRQHGEN